MKVAGINVFHGSAEEITIADGAIASIKAFDGSTNGLLRLAPGLVEIQVNGYAGFDFNTLPLTEDAIAKAVQALWKEGVTSCYPTIITNSDDSILSACKAIGDFKNNNSLEAKSIKGIHLEGPFISPLDGAKGAHDKQYIKAPDIELFKQWQAASGNSIKIVTLSPEWDNSKSFIEYCVSENIRVAIGHSSATYEQISSAVSAGASLSTHLGNGVQGMLPRHPNIIWDQLGNDELYASFIPDGFHIPYRVLKSMFRAKQDRSLLTSDAVYLSGMPAGKYVTHVGGEVVMTPEGKLHIASDENILAGSAQSLKWGIGNLVRCSVLDLGTAWKMASARPAAYLGLPQSRGLSLNAPADIVLFDWDGRKITVKQVYIAGESVSVTQ